MKKKSLQIALSSFLVKFIICSFHIILIGCQRNITKNNSVIPAIQDSISENIKSANNNLFSIDLRKQ